MTYQEVEDLITSKKATLHKTSTGRFSERRIETWKEVPKEYYDKYWNDDKRQLLVKDHKNGFKYVELTGYKYITFEKFYYYAQEEGSQFSIRLNKKIYEKLLKVID